MRNLLPFVAVLLSGCSPPARLPATPAKTATLTKTATPARTVTPSVAQGCGDLLARLGRKPVGVRYTGCKAFPNEQAAPLRATYDVSGRDAAAVEAYLVRATPLKPLKHFCCQWDSPPASFNDASGTQYGITMVSEETTVYRREDWGEIGRFEITVEMLTGEI